MRGQGTIAARVEQQIHRGTARTRKRGFVAGVEQTPEPAPALDVAYTFQRQAVERGEAEVKINDFARLPWPMTRGNDGKLLVVVAAVEHGLFVNFRWMHGFS
ncbi:hypothetical protein D3C86_1544940 [compost metagenome]